LPVAQVSPFLKGLCSYLNSSVPRYRALISESNNLSTEAEDLLKESLISFQKDFTRSLFGVLLRNFSFSFCFEIAFSKNFGW
jgi:hypothetical protein